MPRGNAQNKKTISIQIRLYIIKRDRGVCQYCGKQGFYILRYGKPTVVEIKKNIVLRWAENYNGSGVIPFEIDHILARFHNGLNDVNNLALACRKCNRSKGKKML